MAGNIDISRSGSITRLVLNQPLRRNALNFEMWRQLGEVLQGLATDNHTRLVIVSGAGEQAFSAGADISEFNEWRGGDADKKRLYDATVHAATQALEQFPKPTIAAIRGYCIGGGLELALVCDIRICSDDAQFAVTPARLGIGYDLEDTERLVSRLGAAATREILFTARRYPADEALRLGIVSQVIDSAELDSAVAELSEQIAANAPLTVRASKAIINEALKPPAARDVSLCEQLVAECYASEDYIEGQRAFSEKRRPQFRGC